MRIHPRVIPKLDKQGGFSLIELVVVLAIVGLMFTTAMVMVASPQQERRLRDAHNEIEDLARQAREMSFSYQQPFLVELRAGEVRMMPLANPNAQIVEAHSESEGRNPGLKKLESMAWPRVVTIDPEFQLSVLRWGQDFYVDLVDDEVQRWIHTPNSPCEPLVIMLTSNVSGSYLSREFHPLTAVAEDAELEIRLDP